MKNHYQAFYEAAVAGDEQRIKKMVRDDAYIGEYQQGSSFCNAAFQAALEGQHAAVELLRKYGASPHDIARGYAVAYGYALEEAKKEAAKEIHSVEKIKAHQAKAAEFARKVEEYRRWHGASVNYIGMGFAEGGAVEKADEYLKKYGATHHYLHDYIAMGFARAKIVDKVNEYQKEYNANKRKIIQVYAETGNQKQVENILNNPGNENQRELVKAAMIGYGIGGHEDKLQALIDGYVFLQGYSEERTEAYAIGGNFELIKNVPPKLRGEQCREVSMAYGAARGGHSSVIREIQTKVQDNSIDIGMDSTGFNAVIAEGYARGRHINQVEKIRSKTTGDGTEVEDLENSIVAGYATQRSMFTSADELLYFLSHSNTLHRPSEFLKKLNKECATLDEKELNKLVKKAKQISEYMRKYGMDYEEAQVWYKHSKILFPFVENRFLQENISHDVLKYEVLSRLIGLEPTRIPSFLEKVKNIGLHKSYEPLFEGKSAEQLLESFLKKLDEGIIKYQKYADRRIYTQSDKRKKSIEMVDKKLEALTHGNGSYEVILIEAIKTIKGHINETLSDHRKTSILGDFSFLNTPELVKVYRQALAVLPKGLVDDISAAIIRFDSEPVNTVENQPSAVSNNP